MKKFNDTYADLSGVKYYISDKTSLHFEDAVSKNQIKKIADKGIDTNMISDIFLFPINNKILNIVSEYFDTEEKPCQDSFIIEIKNGIINIFTDTQNGLKYAVCKIASYYENGIGEGYIYNIPLIPFRAVKLYIPARENIEFFKEFVKMCMYYGFNTIVMEVGGAMEYERHPEINEGWLEYCEIFKEYNKKSVDCAKSTLWNKNSIHWENGGGSFLSKKEVKELIDYCNSYGLEVIPEVPSLSHCDYLLTRHPELAENKKDVIPDTYCPSNPDTYKLLFDVLDEVNEVFNPKTVHIAHDEWYSACLCDKCKDRDAGELFAEDINKIYSYLDKKGIETMIWGDMLFICEEPNGNLRGARLHTRKFETEKKVNIKGKEYPVYKELWCKAAVDSDGGYLYEGPHTEKALELVPRNLKIMNWYHDKQPETDDVYQKNGMRMVYGNFHPRLFENWFSEISDGAEGFSVSNWSMADKRHMQRNAVLFNIAYGSMMIWNREFDENKREENTLLAANDLFKYNYKNKLENGYAQIIHGSNIKIPHEQFVDGYCMDEKADCMGHYKIVYEDGEEELYPIYYGLNIGIVIPDWYNQSDDKSGENIGVLEPTCTCDYVMYDKKAFYKLLIPLKKKAVNIIPEIYDKYRENIIIKNIEINCGVIR